MQAECFLWWNTAVQTGQAVCSQTCFVSLLCLFLSQLQGGLQVHDPRATALLLSCHHWAHFQPSEQERSCIISLKLEGASTKNWHLWSPRGIHSHCHLCPKAVWGYSPSFPALPQHLPVPCSGASAGARWEHLAGAHSTFPGECRAEWNWAQGWLISTTAKRNTKFSISILVELNS